ncbi:MAG: type II toxin-antitoxin system VapC family toxin [Cyanobacteria bacterium J06626_6]
MKLLLDTHAFIWWDSAPNKIPAATLQQLENLENEVYVSIASLWEIQIKTQLGKLTLEADLGTLVRQQQSENSISLLPISLPHILDLNQLPHHHRDPFDRILISQSRAELATVVTCDKTFDRYDCKIAW